MIWKNIILVGIGGFVGSALRYYISFFMAAHQGAFPLPAGTLSVNIAGSLLIGILLAAMAGGGWHYLLVAGFCGGFTTFSTFSHEAVSLFREAKIWHALTYISVSLVLCLAATALGLFIGSKLIK